MSSGAPTTFNIQIGDELTWNVGPLLHEIRHALQELTDSGKTGIIDLRSIPLAPGEEDKIIEALGEGEVQARIDALGPSEICETRYPGVWLVTHYNEEREIIGRFIEITDMPEILRSQADEIRQSSARLADYLERPGDNPATSEENAS
ncbi:MAG TPA: hydrogenase expression/formation C-terminal domain-containing protein [Gammaproteobacteria bacterium]|nr:hydrogenase expression/formation C-terminal domain-containing protein [Gammaproteobacteria bacterium]